MEVIFNARCEHASPVSFIAVSNSWCESKCVLEGFAA